MSYIVVSLILFGIDQLTKVLFYGKSMSLVGDILWLEDVPLNTGAAWGSFAGMRWVFVALSIVVSGVIVFFLFSNKFSKSKFFKLTLSVLLGGILGNFFDRLYYAGVRDFIFLKFINFPVFNFADMFITAGTIMLAVYILFLHKKPEKTTKEKE